MLFVFQLFAVVSLAQQKFDIITFKSPNRLMGFVLTANILPIHLIGIKKNRNFRSKLLFFAKMARLNQTTFHKEFLIQTANQYRNLQIKKDFLSVGNPFLKAIQTLTNNMFAIVIFPDFFNFVCFH